jgi:hypothetical protein
MNRLRFGVIAGLIFGALDVIPMIWMDLPDPWIAMIGAFLSRFAIGLLIPAVQWPWPGWMRGLAVALLISLPEAVITGAYGPILGIGAIGGIAIGALVGRAERRSASEGAV